MRSLIVVLCVVFVCTASVNGSTIENIQVELLSGATAEMQSGSITWTGGSGFIYALTQPSGWYLDFTRSELTFSFDLVSEQSGGGYVDGQFDLTGGTWQVDLYDDLYNPSIVAFSMAGTMHSGGPFNGQYWEEGPSNGPLEGSAWLDVNLGGIVTDSGWLSTETFGQVSDLTFSDSVIGLDSFISLDSGSFADYASGTYASTNGLTLEFFDSESEVVPEPATMVLLGLGSLLALRKRRA